ncbi:hypothetical protein ACFWB0_20390 [Rhodococcus sp. NPDC060086]|uniref:hypothetical protein n=1 Tax=Rhodococcus sp. NPDC060086 TaxID=3347055 RepID=UPI00364EC08E
MSVFWHRGREFDEQRTAEGRRFLEYLGDRAARRELKLKFGGDRADVGKLEV